MHRGLIAAQIQNVERIIAENGGHEPQGKCPMLILTKFFVCRQQVFPTWIP